MQRVIIATLASFLASFVHAQEFQGEATFYHLNAGAPVKCGVSITDADIPMAAAINHLQFEGSCGKCAKITGPNGSHLVKLVDECPRCKHGDIDMSLQAFKNIATEAAGRVHISWAFAPCDGSAAPQAAATGSVAAGGPVAAGRSGAAGPNSMAKGGNKTEADGRIGTLGMENSSIPVQELVVALLSLPLLMLSAVF